MRLLPSGTSIRLLLRLAVGLMAGLLLAMVAWQAAVIYLPQYQQARQLEQTSAALDQLLSAADAQRQERDQIHAWLAGLHLGASERGQLSEASERQLDQALTLVEALLATEARSPVQAPLEQVKEAAQVLADLRDRLDQGREVSPAQWMAASSELLQAQDGLAESLMARVGGGGSVLVNSLRQQQALSRAAEDISRERALMARSLLEEDLDLAADPVRNGMGALQIGLDSLMDEQALAPRMNFNSFALFLADREHASHSERIRLAEQALVSILDDHGALRESLRDGTRDNILVEQWLDSGEQALTGMRDLSAAIAALGNSRIADLRRDGLWSIWTVVLMLLAGLALSGFALWTVEGIGRRIQSLSETMDEAARHHDLTLRAEVCGGRELQALAQAFNTMQARFEGIIADISRAAEAASQEMAQVLDTAKSVERGAETQDRDLEQLAAAMEEMATAVEHVAEHTGTTAEAARDADQTARDGRQIVGEAVAVIRGLHQESHQITKVVEVINEIALQTNMLSLNASVEAARAKEHGKGFAVVAEEVRRLAVKTREATAQVQKLLGQFQEHANDALEAMAGQESVTDDDRDQDGHNADAALEKIVKAVNAIRDLSSQVAMAADEQSQAAADMNQRINSISSVSQDTSQAAHRSAQSVDRMEQTLTHLNETTRVFRIKH
ncbi:methyl-accepting chemotaxis protein [Natronospira sp.]|uniref:methyl-accepting chemotaxis protein n=1 Tax=Natronospira sp. TaxID=2024970 RepID=UPI0038730CBD